MNRVGPVTTAAAGGFFYAWGRSEIFVDLRIIF